MEVTCHEVHEKLADFLNGGLDSDTAQHFRSHMANCEHCRTAFSEARRAIRRFLAGTEPGADAKDAAR